MNAATARTVGEAMTRGMVTVRASALMYEAAQLMDAHRVHGLAVIDERDDVIGVVSQTDLLRAQVSETNWLSLRGVAVRHLMSAPAITIGLHATLEQAAVVMDERHVHRLVVVGSDGVTPVGVLSVSDIVHVMANDREYA